MFQLVNRMGVTVRLFGRDFAKQRPPHLKRLWRQIGRKLDILQKRQQPKGPPPDSSRYSNKPLNA